MTGVQTCALPILNVNSTIQYPRDYSILERGIHKIRGIAYTGEGTITRVEISVNGGADWETSVLKQDTTQPYSWVFWDYTWDASKKGEYTIMSRAADSSGLIQPVEAEWNKKGYGYNAIARTRVKIEG